MKKNHWLFIFILFALLSSCSSSKPSSDVWVNKEKIKGKTYSNIFIVVLTGDIDARTKLEDDLVHEATMKGYKAVKSIDAMPVNIKDPKLPGKEEVIAKVKASGCDAVFVASLLKKDESVSHVAGTQSYGLRNDISLISYYGYYTTIYPTITTPSYYDNNKTYLIQSNLYDAASTELMWSVKSEVFSPSSLDHFSTKYTQDLLKKLEDENLLKK